MKIEDIKSLASRIPFQPFRIQLENGEALSVIESTEILFPRNKPTTIFVFEKLGQMWIFDAEVVTALQQ
jgi:hypothetical protein